MDRTEKRERISAWKERHLEMGVVSIKCTATGEQFFEISKDTSRGFNRHRFQLSGNLHRNKYLQELWNTYGEDHFEYGVVSTLPYDDVKDVKMSDLEELLALCLSENPEAKKL